MLTPSTDLLANKTFLYDLIIENGLVMMPQGLVHTDVGVYQGKIVAFGGLKNAEAKKRLDVHGLHVLPGMIDSQVHFREPGLEYKEDLESGTRSAIAGGVTTVFEMPNTNPNTTTAEALAEKLRRCENRAWSNYAFYMGAAGTENAQAMAELELLKGCCGVKIFMGSSTGTLLVSEDSQLEAVLRSGRRRVAIHAEDEARLIERKPLVQTETARVQDHPHWRDVTSAFKATQRILALGEKTKRPLHLLHITSAPEIELLAKNKHITTVEVTPQHLTLFAPDCYDRMGTYAQMNPPIREKNHQDALWWGIQNGVVDVIGSDHAPHTTQEKAKPYPASPAGMTGVQTLVPLLLNHLHNGRLTLERLVDLTAYGPARVFNIVGKGRIALGYDADFTIVDLSAKRVITHAMMQSKVGWTPFDGMQVTGWALYTIVGGHIAMAEDELLGKPQGQVVQFWDTKALLPN
jgi:dihydroorotase